MSVSADGELLAVASARGVIRLWDTETGNLLRSTDISKTVDGLALSPDKSLIVVLGNPAQVLDVSNFRLVTALAPEEGWLVSAHFTPDGQRLVTGTSESETILWDVPGWFQIYSRLQTGDRISSLAISEDGSLIASLSSDYGGDWGWLIVRDAQTGRELHAMRPTTRIYNRQTKKAAVAFSPGGKALAVGYQDESKVQGCLTVYNTEEGGVIKSQHLFHRGVTAVAYSGDGALLAVGFESGVLGIWNVDYYAAPDMAWDLDNAILVVSGSTHGPVHLSSDGRVVAAACDGPVVLDSYGRIDVTLSHEGLARVWETSTGREVQSFDVSPLGITDIALSSSGNRLAAFSYFARGPGFSVWDMQTGVVVAPVMCDRGVKGLALSDSLLAIVRDWVVELWDIPSGRMVSELRGHTERDIGGIAFLPERSTLVSAGDDGTLRFWDTGAGNQTEVVRVSRGPSRTAPLAVSADGSVIACAAENGGVEIRETDTQRVTSRLVVQSRALDASLSGNGQLLALTTRSTRSVQIWNTETGRLLCALDLPWTRVDSVALGPAGDLLAVGISNGYGGAILLCEMHYGVQ